MDHLITREIGIDAGHRVTDHGSKCRNLHGHRYTVQATCAGPLYTDGEQRGMVLDFGFLKEEMMAEIDAPCDHGTILWVEDPLVSMLMANSGNVVLLRQTLAQCDQPVAHATTQSAVAGKLYILPMVPTAENLAYHWYQRLARKVLIRTNGQAKLTTVRVYETPNCWAEFGL